MRMSWGIFLLLLLGQGLAGCSDSPSPVAPSPVPQVPLANPQPSPQPTWTQVAGIVYDSAFRPLSGALVEILDGPQTGMSTMADAAGRFSLSGTFDDTTQFRATKDGYVAGTRTRGPRCATCPYWSIYFYLAVPAAPVSIAGDYTLTFIADSTCTTLPTEARARTYAATIAPGSNPNIPPNTSFNVTVSGASFAEHYDSFPIGVAGDFLTFELRGHGPYLLEQVGENTYLGFDGLAEASVGTSPVSTISTSFDGWIGYCERKSGERGPYYDCSPGQAVAHPQCLSKNHRLILTRP